MRSQVILMSATLDASLFSSYFYDAPTLTIPGRTFAVCTSVPARTRGEQPPRLIW